MPDNTGKLSAEEKALISNWLLEKWGPNRVCPMCGKFNWSIGDHIVQPITLDGNRGLMLGAGVGYPQIMLISNDCGYTVFINAVMIGLVPGIDTPVTPKTGGLGLIGGLLNSSADRR